MADFPVQGEEPYGAKVKAYIDAGDAAPSDIDAGNVTSGVFVDARLPSRLTEAELSASYAARGTKDLAYFNGFKYAAGAFPDDGRLESDHPYEVTYNTAGFTIASDGLRGSGSLTYLNMGPFPGDVSVMEVEGTWIDDAKASDQAIVLIIANGPFANNYPTYADTGCHLLLYRDRWTLQKRRADGAGSTGDVGSFYYLWPQTKTVPFGETVSFKVVRIVNRLYVIRHDGNVSSVAMDADMIAWCGEYATVQIVGSSGSNNRVTVNSFVVGSLPQSEPTPDVFGNGYAKMLTTPPVANTALSGTATIVEQVEIVVPESKVLLVGGSASVSHAGDGVLTVRFDVEGNPNSYATNTLLESQAFNGVVNAGPLAVNLTDFAVGSIQTLFMRLTATGTATLRTSPSGPIRRGSVYGIPVTGTFA